MTSHGRPEPTPWGTRRRLQALMNRGWSPQALQAATGLPAKAITETVTSKMQPSPGLDDRRVAAVYEWAWQRHPPAATPADRQRAAAARETAERLKWPPPMAWDDDIIDQPDGQPAPGWRRTSDRHRAADLVEDLTWIRQQGGYRHAPTHAAAARLGVKPDTLLQACYRVASRQAELEAG
jgi:hypothetical protein